MLDALNEEALLHIASNNSRTGIAPFQQAVAIVEAQACFTLRRPVTFIALGSEHGTDLLFEELLGLGFDFRRDGAACEQEKDGEVSHGNHPR